MIFTRLRNPYHNPLDPKITRKVIADVSEEDYDVIYRSCPFRGTQGYVIGSLVKKLAQAIRNNQISHDYVPDPDSLQSLIAGVTFPQISGPGPLEADRRREENAGRSPARTSPISAEESLSQQQTIKKD